MRDNKNKVTLQDLCQEDRLKIGELIKSLERTTFEKDVIQSKYEK